MRNWAARVRGSPFPAADHGRVVWAFNPVISQRQWLFLLAAARARILARPNASELGHRTKAPLFIGSQKKITKGGASGECMFANRVQRWMSAGSVCFALRPVFRYALCSNRASKAMEVRKKSVRCPKLAHRDFVAACDGNKKSATHWEQWYFCEKTNNFSHKNSYSALFDQVYTKIE